MQNIRPDVLMKLLKKLRPGKEKKKADERSAALSVAATRNAAELRHEAAELSASKTDRTLSAAERKDNRAELSVVRLALRALEQYENLDPYSRQYCFPPSDAGEHVSELPQLKENTEIDRSADVGLSVEEVIAEYGPWKRFFNLYVQRAGCPGERGMQVELSDFLRKYSQNPGDIQHFQKMEGCEADIVFQTLGRSDFTTVEVKVCKSLSGGAAAILRAGIYQASLYAIKGCMQAGVAGHYDRKVATITLPAIMSLFGVARFDLDGEGNMSNFRIEIGKPHVWGDTKESLQEQREEIARREYIEIRKDARFDEETAKLFADSNAGREIEEKVRKMGLFASSLNGLLFPEDSAACRFINYARRCFIGLTPAEEESQASRAPIE
ncbi:MAG: uncharacterized protein A8A55_2725 [Amphiamblys sp. WSBS2006]|nr:MAG: uncharacterized protein A8A55_2725 [Amphiamblys sp. WSBS2006]